MISKRLNTIYIILIVILLLVIIFILASCDNSKEDSNKEEDILKDSANTISDYTPIETLDWDISTPEDEGLSEELVGQFYIDAEEVETIKAIMMRDNLAYSIYSLENLYILIK